MLVEIYVDPETGWTPAPMQLEVELRYYTTAEDDDPIHIDTLVFAISQIVGPTPSVGLRDPATLRTALYNRMRRIDTETSNLQTMKFLLDQLPPGHRMTQSEVLRMLEGALD